MDEQQINRQLGLRVKAFRKANNLTQDAFGAMIGLEPGNVSNIERGITFPSKTTLCAMIEKAHIEPNFLLGFLYNDTKPYSSIDFEIVEKIIDLPEKAKNYYNMYLHSL